MPYDPTTLGTYRHGYHVRSLTWKGANRSGGYAKATGWSAMGTAHGFTNDPVASNNLTIDAARNAPVVGVQGCQHAASWKVGLSKDVAAYKAAGSTWDTSTSTGVCIAGVLLAPRGASGVSASTGRYIVNMGAADRAILRLKGSEPKFEFVDAAAVNNSLSCYLSARPTPFVMRINSGGYRLRVGGYSSAFTGSQTGGNCGNIIYLLCNSGQNAPLLNGVQFVSFHDGDTTSMSDSVMDAAITSMQADFNLPTPTVFGAGLGHSWMSGMWQHGADSVIGGLQDAYPEAAWYNFSESGAAASDLDAQITRMLACASACGFTPVKKVAVIFIGENEMNAGAIGTFAADTAAAAARLTAAGFRVVFMDVHPFANIGDSDATVISRQAVRVQAQTALRALRSGRVQALSYTDQGVWYPNIPSGGTNAQKRAAIDLVLDSRLEEISVLDADDPTALTDSQRLHPGTLGGRNLIGHAVRAADRALGPTATSPRDRRRGITG